MIRGYGLRKALARDLEKIEYVMDNIIESKAIPEEDKKEILDKLQNELIDGGMEFEDMGRMGLYDVESFYN